MIYVYQKTDNIYIVTEEKINGTAPILVLMWNKVPYNNIRPWIYLKYNSPNYYKQPVLDYFKLYLNEKEAPQEELLQPVSKDQVEEIFKEYIKILKLFKSLELIITIPEINYSHLIIYQCDIKNYLEDILGGKILEKCDDFLNLENHKKDIIKKIGDLRSEDAIIKYLEDKEVDNDVYQYLPPWLKVSYQIFGEGHKTIKRKSIPEIEYDNPNCI